MATTRTTTAAANGPTRLSVVLAGASGTITAHVDPTCHTATVTISTSEDTGPAAQAVHATRFTSNTRYLIAEVFGTSGVKHLPVDETNTIAASTGTPNTQSVRVHAVLPPGSSVTASTQSADVRVDGPAATVWASTDEGAVTITSADDVHVRTDSGAVTIGTASQVEARTESGPVSINTTSAATVKTWSGDVRIASSQGNVQVNTYAGVITLHATQSGLIDVMTGAANINITATPDVVDAVPAGLAAGMRQVCARTGSGRISVPDEWRRLILPRFRAQPTATS